VPYLKQEEPLKVECQHFLDCIQNGKTPMSDGRRGLELVKILEAASASLKVNGAAIAIQESGVTSLTTAAVPRMVGEPRLVCA
jgi:predicted dehydrogenase